MIVTGCQRSGTKTLAAIFGIHHEVQFTPRTCAVPAQVASEVSWLAVPWLQEIASRSSAEQMIVHLVRDPVDVINSLEGINFWKDMRHGHYLEFVYKHLGTVNRRDSSIVQSVQYWVGWNRLIEDQALDGVQCRLRIEDIHTAVRLNHRERAHLTLGEILDALSQYEVLREEFLAMKEDYGYSII